MENLFDITGKIAVITGGAGVLGGTIAKKLLASGAKVAILDLKKEIVDQRVIEFKKVGEDVIGLDTNVLDKAKLEKNRNTIVETWGRVDILLNAAGGNMAGATIGPGQTIFDLSIDAFQKVSELNLNGTVLPSLVFGQQMARQKSGVIINFSSMTAQKTITRVVGYSAAKAAIDNFTKWMAVEMATKFGEGIRVNAIAPGFFVGDQNRKLLLNGDGSLTDRGKTIINHTPMGRFGEAEELSGTIQYLCSDASKFVTGVVIPIDGGFSAFSGV